jgi:hypothetical protein
MAPRVFPGDEERQLERVFEAELRQFARSGQSGDDVAALQRPLEDRMWTAMRGRRCSSPERRRRRQSMGRGFDPLSPATGHGLAPRYRIDAPEHFQKGAVGWRMVHANR